MASLLKYFVEHPSVTIDSRNIKPGQIFFAIKGEHFDGNDFVMQALQEGAAYCIASNPVFHGHDRIIVVDDTLEELQDLAREYRGTFKFPVLAITGSNGKTTSKELLSAVLSTKFKVHCTYGNLNNHLGVPLTLLATPPDTDFAVVEMGANHQGEIRELCAIAKPDYGCITNIVIAHLEGFGGLDGVRKGKSELFEYLMEHHGTFFINVQENSLDFLNDPNNEQLVRISTETEEITILKPTTDFLSFGWYDLNVDTHLVGQYNFNNILIALGVGRYFGCDGRKMCEAISSYVPRNNRSQMIEYRGAQVIMDAYNANPSSVISALDNLIQNPGFNKGLVLGDMLELGEDSAEYHRKILEYIRKADVFSPVMLIGPRFRQFEQAFPEFQFFGDTDEAVSMIDWKSMAGYTVLVKGSRGVRLEKLVN